MTRRANRTATADGLTGTIETRVAGARHHQCKIYPGDELSPTREPQNPKDPNAIALRGADGEPAGWVPCEVAAWLAPLVDEHLVAIEARVPRTLEADYAQSRRIPLRLTIRADERILHTNGGGRGVAFFHDLIAQTYQDLHSSPQPALIEEVARLLGRLDAEGLMPRTRLLLALLPSLAREAARALAAHEAQAGIRRLLGKLEPREPIRHGAMTIYPLFRANGHKPGYSLIEDALAGGTAGVDERGQHGHVPCLIVTNRGGLPLLLPEGMILVGLKQNRVVNETTMVAAASVHALPVSCVEQGRWRHDFSHVTTSSAPSKLRYEKMKSIKRNRELGRGEMSDQGAVWDEVAACLDEIGTASPTGSLTDGYKVAGGAIKDYRAHFVIPEGAAGVLVAHGDRIAGMELFDAPASLARCRDRLAQSYAVEMARRDQERTHGPVRRRHNREFDQGGGPGTVYEAAPEMRVEGGGDDRAAGTTSSPGAERSASEALPLAADWFLKRVAELARPRPEDDSCAVSIDLDADGLTGSGLWYEGELVQMSVVAQG